MEIIPKKLEKRVESLYKESLLASKITGKAYTRNTESWLLLKRYSPFLTDIIKTRELIGKPSLDSNKDWQGYRSAVINGIDIIPSTWAQNNCPKIEKLAIELGNSYKSPELKDQILYFLLYDKDYISKGSPYNYYINKPKRSEESIWTTIEIMGPLDKKGTEDMTNYLEALLYETIMDDRISPEPKKINKGWDTSNKNHGKIVATIFLTNEDYNSHKQQEYCRAIIRESNKEFKKYKISTELYKNIVLLEEYEKEYVLMKYRLGNYNYEPEYTLGPNDVIYEIYSEEADEIMEPDLIRIRENIRKIKERIKKQQEKRFT